MHRFEARIIAQSSCIDGEYRMRKIAYYILCLWCLSFSSVALAQTPDLPNAKNVSNHELGVSLGIGLTNSSADYVSDIGPDLLFDVAYGYRATDWYRPGLAFEFGLVGYIFPNIIRAKWTNEFTVYRRDDFNFYLSLDVGYSYVEKIPNFKYENHHGQYDYIIQYRHGFTIGAGMGMQWRASRVVSLKLAIRVVDELLFGLERYGTTEKESFNEVAVDVMFGPVFHF